MNSIATYMVAGLHFHKTLSPAQSFLLEDEDEGGGAWKERKWRKKGNYSIWPTSLKSHCQHICHTVQHRNDCATEGLFIYLTDIIIISIIYVAPVGGDLRADVRGLRKCKNLQCCALCYISGGRLHHQIFISGINCSRVPFSF